MTSLDYFNDKSVRVSSGKNSFDIAFCEVPKASDKADRRFHNVHTPLTNRDGSAKGNSTLPSFPFTIYNGAKWKDTAEVGNHYLAIEG